VRTGHTASTSLNWKAGARVKNRRDGRLGTIKGAPWHLLVVWDGDPQEYLVHKNEVDALTDDEVTHGS
jgi:hypothetical protein